MNKNIIAWVNFLNKFNMKEKQGYSFIIKISFVRKWNNFSISPSYRSSSSLVHADNANRRAYLLGDHWRRNPTSLGAAEYVEAEICFLG